MSAKNTTFSSSAGLPLHRKWVVWYDNPRLAKEGTAWKDNLKHCGTFSTVEEFWEIFNNLKPASTLVPNSNYHIFKEGVIPMWEDDANKKGGKFVLTMQKRDSKAGKLDEWWLFSVLAMVGETMDSEGDEICGSVVSIRKGQDRIAIWLKSCEKDSCIKVGARWKKALEVSNKTNLKYQAHKDGEFLSLLLVLLYAFGFYTGVDLLIHIVSSFSFTFSRLQWKFLKKSSTL